MQPDFNGNRRVDTDEVGDIVDRAPCAEDLRWERSNLTRSQQLIWLALQLSPDTPIFNMIHASEIRGALDPAAFTNAMQAVVDASDALRTTIEVVDGVPQQKFNNAMAFELETVDLSAEHDPEGALTDWIDLRKTEVFDPAARLFSSAIIKLGSEKFVWYLSQSHLIADATSFALLFDAVASCYKDSVEGRPIRAPDLPPFADYIRREHEFVGSAMFRKAWVSEPERKDVAGEVWSKHNQQGIGDVRD